MPTLVFSVVQSWKKTRCSTLRTASRSPDWFISTHIQFQFKAVIYRSFLRPCVFCSRHCVNGRLAVLARSRRTDALGFNLRRSRISRKAERSVDSDDGDAVNTRARFSGWLVNRMTTTTKPGANQSWWPEGVRSYTGLPDSQLDVTGSSGRNAPADAGPHRHTPAAGSIPLSHPQRTGSSRSRRTAAAPAVTAGREDVADCKSPTTSRHLCIA